MKVKELIEKLKKCNPESEVVFESEEWIDNWVDGYNEGEISYNTHYIDNLTEDEEHNVVTLYEED